MVFTAVQLQLPFMWQLSLGSQVYQCLINRLEIALVLFIECNNLINVI